MTRPALASPRLPVRARAHLEPSGAHVIEVDCGLGGHVRIGVGDLPRLRAALEAFETEVRIDDGHNNRVNAAIKHLGEF